MNLGMTDTIKVSLKNLKDYAEKHESKRTEILDELQNIQEGCNKGLSHRVQAAKEGAYDIILSVIHSCEDDTDVLRESLKAMLALMTTQPDLLTEPAVNLKMRLLTKPINGDITIVLLKWMKECCVKHEANRFVTVFRVVGNVKILRFSGNLFLMQTYRII